MKICDLEDRIFYLKYLDLGSTDAQSWLRKWTDLLVTKWATQLSSDQKTGLLTLSSTEKAMAPHSSTLAWKIPWMEEPGRLQSMGSLESDTTEWLHFHFSLSCIGEGNSNPRQCSCLENPRDREAWWAAVSGVTQSRTRLKQLSSSSSMFLLPFS